MTTLRCEWCGSDSNLIALIDELTACLHSAMVLLADADDKLSDEDGDEGLLESLFDDGTGFALDFYNEKVAGDATR